MKTIATYPALVVLPIVSYFSFGKIQEKVSQPTLGLALSWKWTFVNMLMSLSVTTALHMHEMTQINLTFLHMSVTESVGSGGPSRGWSSQATYIGAWSKDVLVSSLLTILLYWHQEPVYGVLLPELTQEPHVMKQGQVEPLGISSPAKYSRQTGFQRKSIYPPLFLHCGLQVGAEAEISEAPSSRPSPPDPDHHWTPCGKRHKPLN